MTLSRRRFLKGIGGITVALPWLEQLAGRTAFAQTMGARPRRVIVVTYQMGIPVGQWKPSADGTGFALPYVTAPLEPFRDRCLFVSDLDHEVLNEGGSAFRFGHPGKTQGALTGTLTTGAFPTNNNNHIDDILSSGVSTDGGANSESIEQRIGASLRANQPFSSVDLGIDGARRQESLPSRFFFESRATPVTMEGTPMAAFDRLFAGVMPGNNEAERALRDLRSRNKSVLDAVRASFADLARDLGSDDRRRLDEHAARIRQIELNPAPPPSCERPTGIQALNNPRMDQLAPPMIEILAQAMACDLAPIGRLEFIHQQSPRFGIPALDNTLDATVGEYDWHAMVHGDPLPGTSEFLRPGRDESVTTYDSRLLDGYRFFVQQFADLLAALDRFPEGQGTTVLDNSLVILATDLGDGGGHYHGKMGYIMAGNLGGARRNFHFSGAGADARPYTPSRYNVTQLLNSILDMAQVTDGAGQPVTDFGLRGFIERTGAPRRIDALFA